MRCTPLKEHTVEISLFGLFLQVYTLRSGRDNTVCASKSKLTLHVQYVLRSRGAAAGKQRPKLHVKKVEVCRQKL